MRSNALVPQSVSGTRDSLFVAISFHNGALTIQPAGPHLAERESMIISREAGVALRRHAQHLRCLVMDFSDVQQVSSFGLGLCIELRTAAAEHAAHTIVYSLAPHLMDLFRMVKVDRLYTFAGSRWELERAIAET